MQQVQVTWKKKVILFLISQSVTLFGSQIVQMAIVWYVTLHTTSGAWVAVFSVCSYLPQFLVSFAGGVWADRYNRKFLIIGADSGIAVVTFSMLLIMPYISTEIVLLGLLIILSVLRSIGAGIQSPAVSAVIPQLVPPENLMRYNGLNAMMQSVVQFSAPAVAGIVLSAGTLQNTLLIDILTAIAGIALLSWISLPKQEERVTSSPILSDMRNGVNYVFSKKIIGILLAIYGLFTFLCVPAGYLSGLLVSRTYGDTYWYLTAVEICGFGGMAVGGLLMSVWGGFQKRSKTLFIGFAVFGAMAIGMGITQNFLLYLIFMICYGVALTTIQTTITTLLQENTNISMQGRVFGFMGAMYAVCYPFGMAVFGPLADIIPLQWVMIGSGMILLLMPVFLHMTRL